VTGFPASLATQSTTPKTIDANAKTASFLVVIFILLNRSSEVAAQRIPDELRRAVKCYWKREPKGNKHSQVGEMCILHPLCELQGAQL
jgi:hypothetical protein